MSDTAGQFVQPGRARAFLTAVADLSIASKTGEILAIAALMPVLLSAALWNGFPIVFYDTGAYMLQGYGHFFIPERSPVYSLFLRVAGPERDLWIVALVQCLTTAFMLVELGRALKPQMRLWLFLGIVVTAALATSLPWYAGQIQPDCFIAVAVIAVYLLAFHARAMGGARSALLLGVAAFAISTHMTHIFLITGLIAVLAALWLAARVRHDLPRPNVVLPATSLVLALGILVSANYIYTRHVFVSRTGSVFLMARMMQDGLIKRVLDDTCPEAHYKLCAYKDSFPDHADTFLWMEHKSPFKQLGGFRKMEAESAALVHESLRRYPLRNLGWALADTVLQFGAVSTGDGIVPQEWIMVPEFRYAMPGEMQAYAAALQQTGALKFELLNVIHIPVAVIATLALFWLLWREARRRRWAAATLPAFLLLALLGNAFICGVGSGPHFRYQSRLVWLPALALMLLAAERLPALRRRQID